MQDGTLEDNIPSRSVECPSACNHSDVRGIYLLDDEEVQQLKNHPGVINVTINVQHIQEPIWIILMIWLKV